ncbi:MAG TPA: UDP-N-acetylmuramoyl-L-alanyl-D-glutamate--2,6-diaminopimelate ligase [Solirubrobacteraceae bacterium]|jgi:UDP-N-acetylmuramoyl-L-alanyl-D-glutamate--2,6-diaminopimelate ligase
MRLAELIPTAAPGSEAVEIAALAYDSRQVKPGALFFCVTGEHSDGHDFAAQAVRDGAVALVVERSLDLGVPEVLVPSARAAMGPVAARFHGDPSAELRVVGVTGTNGKTTTAYLLRALLEATGERCGLLGTVASVIAGVERPVTHTTPEAIELQSAFRAMLDGGESACAMEVSSHSLEMGRVDGIHFAAAIFTNLTQDHLDFHADMEQYFQAKRRLFMPEPTLESSAPSKPPAIVVVNIDDPYGQRLAAELPGAVSFAIKSQADYCARDVRMDFSGCRFALETPEGERSVALPLPGRFNVANALAALAASHTMGADLDTLVAALERGVRVPGRFEPVQEGQDFAVLVDYAHTPDSLENVLRAARELARGRVVCVFGAGGDRDRGKRPLMGEIAARLADVVVVTSDNPRSESPEAIVAEIVAGIDRSETVQVAVDRRAAIKQAIALARTDDVVVIAGKGHEQGQEFEGGHKLPFDDVTVAREALRAQSGHAAEAAA